MSNIHLIEILRDPHRPALDDRDYRLHLMQGTQWIDSSRLEHPDAGWIRLCARNGHQFMYVEYGTILRVNGVPVPPEWYLAPSEPWVEIVIIRGELTMADFDVEVVDG